MLLLLFLFYHYCSINAYIFLITNSIKYDKLIIKKALLSDKKSTLVCILKYYNKKGCFFLTTFS